jgi:hypothetical protein
MKTLVEEITGDQPIDGTMEQSRRKQVLANQRSGSRRDSK